MARLHTAVTDCELSVYHRRTIIDMSKRVLAGIAKNYDNVGEDKNNRGSNPEEVPKGLVHFLQYTKEALADSGEYSEDAYIQRIQESIRKIKGSREMGERYMTLQEMLKEERQEGRQESLTIVRQVNSGELTLEEGADKLEISVEELLEIMGAHPRAASVVDQEGNA